MGVLEVLFRALVGAYGLLVLYTALASRSGSLREENGGMLLAAYTVVAPLGMVVGFLLPSVGVAALVAGVALLLLDKEKGGD